MEFEVRGRVRLLKGLRSRQEALPFEEVICQTVHQGPTYSSFFCQDERKFLRHEVVHPGQNVRIPGVEGRTCTLLFLPCRVGGGASLAVVPGIKARSKGPILYCKQFVNLHRVRLEKTNRTLTRG